MARKRSKNRGGKPKILKPATLVDTSTPQSTQEYSQVDQQALLDREQRQSNQALPAAIIVDAAGDSRRAANIVAAAAAAVQKVISESDFPTPIPGSTPFYSDDAEIEILGEEEDENAAARFVNEMSVEEMVEDVFANLQTAVNTPSESAKPTTIVSKPLSEIPEALNDCFDIDLTDFDPDDDGPKAGIFQAPPRPTAPTTVAPPPAETDFDPHQTGDYTVESELLWEFLNSPAASIYYRAQQKFEQTKNIADKPHLDNMIRDFQLRKGGFKR